MPVDVTGHLFNRAREALWLQFDLLRAVRQKVAVSVGSFYSRQALVISPTRTIFSKGLRPASDWNHGEAFFWWCLVGYCVAASNGALVLSDGSPLTIKLAVISKLEDALFDAVACAGQAVAYALCSAIRSFFNSSMVIL